MDDLESASSPTETDDPMTTESTKNHEAKNIDKYKPNKVSRAGELLPRRVGKRGRKPSRIDTKARLERSRQSARECRARKKLRYQYVEELVTSRERAIDALRNELQQLKQYCSDLDDGDIPADLKDIATVRKKDPDQ